MNAYLAEMTAIGGRIEALAKQKMLEEIEAMPGTPDRTGSGLGDYLGKKRMRENLPDVSWVTPMLEGYALIQGGALDGSDAVADLEAAMKSFDGFRLDPLGRTQGIVQSLQRTLSTWEGGAGESFTGYYVNQLSFHSNVQEAIMDATVSAFQSYLDLFRRVREVGLQVAQKTETALANLQPRAVVVSAALEGYLAVLGVGLEVAAVTAPQELQIPVGLTKILVKITGDAVEEISVDALWVADILKSMSELMRNAAEQSNQARVDLNAKLSGSHDSAQNAVSDAIPSYPPFTDR